MIDERWKRGILLKRGREREELMNALTAKEITELNQGKRKNKGGEAKFSVNKRGRIYKPMIFVCINDTNIELLFLPYIIHDTSASL